MKDTVFINVALDKAIKNYLASISEPDGIAYNSFLVVVIRTLAFIYSKPDILNPYYLQNQGAFLNNLSKYGMSKSNIMAFLDELYHYDEFDIANQKKKFIEKNPYFITVQKYLVDMFILKNRNSTITYQEEETFLQLIYTTHMKDWYRLSINYKLCCDPNFIEKYYYSRLNEQDITRIDLNKTINAKLDLNALNYMGINLSNINNHTEKELIDAQNNVYAQFQIDEKSLNKESDLKKAINYFELHGKKVTTGNGYVDILLLMSVIVTSLSVVLIIIFSL